MTSGPRLGEQGIRAVIHHGRPPRSQGGSSLVFRQLLPRCRPLPPQLSQLRLRCGAAPQPLVSFRHYHPEFKTLRIKNVSGPDSQSTRQICSCACMLLTDATSHTSLVVKPNTRIHTSPTLWIQAAAERRTGLQRSKTGGARGAAGGAVNVGCLLRCQPRTQTRQLLRRLGLLLHSAGTDSVLES